MNQLTAVLLLAALSPFAMAQEKRVDIDPSATEINWTLPGNVHTVHGTFKLKRGHILFNPANGAASGELVADATSGESGNGDRDGRMHKNIIESPKYGEITFVPDRIIGPVNLSGDSNIQIHGVFRIHGGEHEATLAGQSHIAGNQLNAALKVAIPYVQWGMKNPSNFLLRVNPVVDIEIKAAGRL